MVLIEPAKSSDVDEIQALLSCAWEHTYAGVLSPETIEKIKSVWYNVAVLKNYIADRDVLFLVARESEGAVLGVATSIEIDRKTAQLTRLYVHPDSQGQGIGIDLMGSVIAHYPKARVMRAEVFEKNEKGRAFYVKQGFREVDKTVANVGNDTLMNCIMERPIDN